MVVIKRRTIIIFFVKTEEQACDSLKQTEEQACDSLKQTAAAVLVTAYIYLPQLKKTITNFAYLQQIDTAVFIQIVTYSFHFACKSLPSRTNSS